MLAAPCPLSDRFGHDIHIVGNLRNQHHICPAPYPRTQGQPTDLVAHGFYDDDAVVTVGRTVQPIDGFSGDTEGSVVTKRDVRSINVIVDGFRQVDDVNPLLCQPVGILGRAATAYAYQRMQVVLMVDLDHGIGHVQNLTAHRHFVRLIATGAQYGSADGEYARQRIPIEGDGTVLHQASKTVQEPDHTPAVLVDRRFSNGANGGIESGAIAARCDNANGFRHTNPL